MSRTALFVSSSAYADDQLARLPSAASDAVELGRLFADPGIGSFSVDMLTDPRAQDMREALENLFADATPDDVVVLYMSGHGMKDQHGNLFFAANDTRPGRLQSTAVSAQFLCSVLNASRANGAVVFLDCCYGGAFARGMVARAGGDSDVGEAFAALGGGPRSRAVITASSAIEYAFEGDQLADSRAEPSVFASAMCDGILRGEADRDGDGWVGLNELFDFVRTRIQRLGKPQTPHLWNFGASGDLRLTRSPTGPHASTRSLPAEIRELLSSPMPVVRLGTVADLEQRARDADLGAARAAVAALQELTGDDSLRVQAAAATALAGTALRVEPAEVTVTTDGTPTRARLLGSPVARDAYPEALPDGMTATVVNDEILISAGPGVAPGRVELTLRWTGGVVPLGVLVERVDTPTAKARAAVPQPTRTPAIPPPEPRESASAPSRRDESPSDSSHPSVAASWQEGSWLAVAGGLYLLSLVLPLYDYEGSENALYSASAGQAYAAAIAGLVAVAIGALRLFRIGGRATLFAGLLAAALLVAFAVGLLADAYADDSSVGPAGLCALLVIGSAITHVAAAGARALRTRRN